MKSRLPPFCGRVPLADADVKGYSMSGAALSIAVEDDAGRVYVVQTANAPTGSWEKAEFFLAPGDAAPVNLIFLPSTPGGGPTTVYLLPAPDRDAAFFRVKSDDAKAED